MGAFGRGRVLVLQHRPVTGQVNRHLVTAIRQRARQRADRVSEAAGLHVREKLTRDVDDFHRSHPTRGVY